MTIIQSEASSIAVESLEAPQVQVEIEEVVDNDEVDNNIEEENQENRLEVDPHSQHRISIISDTDYNASAESNSSSRRSSVDVPHFELCSHRDHRRINNYGGDEQSEVGRL